MFAFFWSLLFFIIALGILVAVHEWGHFWVARKCGVKVHTFSIGFGKALWSRKDKLGTEYVVAAIPLGGYVRMLDERVEDVAEDEKHLAFNRQHVLKRIAIIAAGPGTNFIFAIFALMLMYMIGVDKVKPVVGHIEPQSIAAKAGIPEGAEFTRIGKYSVLDWQAVNMELVAHIGEPEMTVEYKLPGSTAVFSKRLDLSDWQFDPQSQSSLASLGIRPFRPEAKTSLAFIAEDSAAAKAGLKKGETIVSIDGTPMQKWEQIVSYIAERPSETVTMVLTAQHQSRNVTVTIGERKVGDKIQGYLGVVPNAEPWPESYLFNHQYGPVDAIIAGMGETWRLTTLSLEMIGKLITGDVSVKNLSGPISIAQGAGASASYGLVYFLSFLALISVNLGVINLLPLPVLDGGHLLYYVIEFLTGKPVPEKVQEIGFRVGGALLMLLMTVAIVNDVTRL